MLFLVIYKYKKGIALYTKGSIAYLSRLFFAHHANKLALSMEARQKVNLEQ